MLSDFYGPFKDTLAKADAEMRDVKREEIKTDIVCEKCGSPMVIKCGQDGPLPRLHRLPGVQEHEGVQARRATGRSSIVENEEVPTDEKCDKCGKPMVVKRGRFGRFLACTGYPECKGTKPMSIGVACPECKQRLPRRAAQQARQDLLRLQPLPGVQVRRLGPAARRGAARSARRRTCSQKYSKRDGAFIACPNKECDYRREVVEPGMAPAAGATPPPPAAADGAAPNATPPATA